MKKIVLLLCTSIVCYTMHGQDKTKRNVRHRVPHTKTQTPDKKRTSPSKKQAIIAQLATQNQNESLAFLQEALAQSQTLIQKVQSFEVSPDTPTTTSKRHVKFDSTPQVHTFNPSDPISSTLPTTPPTHLGVQSTTDHAPQEPAPHVPFYNPETFNTPKHKRFVKWQERYDTASTSAPDIALPVSSGDVSPTEIQQGIDFIAQNHLSHVKYRNELYNKIAVYIQKYFTYSKWYKTLKPRSTDPREISQRIYELTEMLSICSRYYPLDTYQFYSNGWLSDEPMTAKDVQQILHPEHQSIAANSVQTTRIPQDDAKTDILIALQNIQQNASLAQTPAEKNRLYEDIATFLEQHFEMDWYGYIVQKSYVPQFIVQQIQTIVRQCAEKWPTDEYPFFNIHPMLYSTRDTLAISYLSSIISYYDYRSPQDIINPTADPERGEEVSIVPATMPAAPTNENKARLETILAQGLSTRSVQSALKFISDKNLEKSYRDIVYKKISEHLALHFDIEPGSVTEADGALTLKTGTDIAIYEEAKAILALCAQYYPTDAYRFYDAYDRTAASIISSLYKA